MAKVRHAEEVLSRVKKKTVRLVWCGGERYTTRSNS